MFLLDHHLLRVRDLVDCMENIEIGSPEES